MTFLSGFIGIIGAPNVGKSTLLNRILDQKLTIVSPKPQTTRNRILGVYHGDKCQMVFMDTPGIHKTSTALHRSMVESAIAAFHEVDIILTVIEMGKSEGQKIKSVIGDLKSVKMPKILVINKIDNFPKVQLLPTIEKWGQMAIYDSIIPVSALRGDGIEILMEEIKLRLKPGPRFFPEDTITDQPESFMVSEIIREKIYGSTKKELPYSSAVTIDEMKEVSSRNLLSIAARIHVETDSQKMILIGKKGQMIKRIGRSSRLELEKMFGVQVYLDLKVRVEKNWTRDTRALRRLGY